MCFAREFRINVDAGHIVLIDIVERDTDNMHMQILGLLFILAIQTPYARASGVSKSDDWYKGGNFYQIYPRYFYFINQFHQKSISSCSNSIKLGRSKIVTMMGLAI